MIVIPGEIELSTTMIRNNDGRNTMFYSLDSIISCLNSWDIINKWLLY